MLSKVKVARLAAYYEYDVALMNLLALCEPEHPAYASTVPTSTASGRYEVK